MSLHFNDNEEISEKIAFLVLKYIMHSCRAARFSAAPAPTLQK